MTGATHQDAHEDATVYGSGVVLHPLEGRPEFQGVTDSPAGPYARIQDGDLVLQEYDVPTLMRWAQQFELAAEQLASRIEEIATSERRREAQA